MSWLQSKPVLAISVALLSLLVAASRCGGGHVRRLHNSSSSSSSSAASSSSFSSESTTISSSPGESGEPAKSEPAKWAPARKGAIYVSQTPAAPADFVSSTLAPSGGASSSWSGTSSTSSRPHEPSGDAGPAVRVTKKLIGSGVTKKKPKRALLEAHICGRVPIFERELGQSINETFAVKTEDQDDEADSGAGDFRVLHGMDARRGEWPWIAKIEVCSAPGECGSCTGSLINSRWLLTAGHCASGKLELYSAQLGLYDLLVRDSSALNVTFDRLVRHPHYSDKFDNDLALLRLSQPVAFSTFIQPVCLVDSGRAGRAVALSRRRKCYNVGYGLTVDMTAALKLQKLEVEAKHARECNEGGQFSVHLRANDLCMGPRSGRIGASCRGDSGGPNSCYDPHTNQWYLFSSVSYGPTECDREEGDKWLTVAVDLSRYHDWISQTIEQNS